MFDVLIYRLAALSELTLIAIAFALILIGGGIGLLTQKGQSRLLGSAFFVRQAALGAALALSRAVWLLYIPAIKGGYAWVLLAVDVGGNLAFGIALMELALARSRDAYGHARRAWFAFVPILNLVLLFKPSHDVPADARQSPDLAAIVVGLVLFGMSRWIPDAIDDQAKQLTARTQDDPAFVTLMTDIGIRSDGIEARLDAQIALEGAPYEVEPGLTLVAVVRHGRDLRYAYVLDEPGATSLSAEYRRIVRDGFCNSLSQYLSHGATAHVRYDRVDGVEIETVPITLAACTV